MNFDHIQAGWKKCRGTRAVLVASALAALSGCIAVPVHEPYAGSPPYGSGHGYYDAPAPAYYAAPAYYGPAVGVEVYGGNRGYSRGYQRGYGYR